MTLPREMFIAQQLMLLVLRNAFEILVLTAVNHSETGMYDMPLESGRTLIILEVRRRLWCLFSAYDRSARKPRKKKIKNRK